MIPEQPRVIAHTQSLCPHCLKKIKAQRVERGDSVFLVKVCPDHGPMETLIWEGTPKIHQWVRNKTQAGPEQHATHTRRGCPFDCGICPQHRQRTCTTLVEVTQRCNLNCPVCFADSSDRIPDPDLDEIQSWFQRIKDLTNAQCNIQISGGEPTVRDDLPEIIRMGKSMGFNFIQVNTNGLRIADDESFLQALKQAGLDSLFLQFDGMDDRVHRALRGRPLQAVKERAIAHCQEHNLGVVLVPTLVPGINDAQVGDIIRFGLDRSPHVRGVHFQPISYFGRFPDPTEPRPRITLPRVIQHIESQAGLDPSWFRPPG